MGKRLWEFWAFVRDVFARAGRDEVLALSGNIAYTSLLSFFPFLIFLTALAGFVGNEELAATVIDYLLSVAPDEVVAPFESDIKALLTHQNGRVLTYSIVFSAYVATHGVESVRLGLNRAYGFREKRRWGWRTLQNLAFVIGSAFVLLALAVLIVFAPLWWDKAVEWFPSFGGFISPFNRLRVPIGLGLMFIGLLLGHWLIPFKRQRLRTVLPGILITIALWYWAAQLFTIYVTKFSRAQIMYASLGNIIMALLFVYISAMLILLGAEINQALKVRKSDKLAANDDTEIVASPVKVGRD